jgi:hypothetical protein
MVDMLIRREGRWLAPDRAPDVAQLERLRDGHSFYAKIIYRRSIQHHRWWRGLVHIVADGLGVDQDLLHDDIKAKAGLVRVLLLSNNDPVTIPRSTAFEAMDEARYTAFVDMGVEIIFRDYLPGVRRESVFERVREMVGHDRPTG